MKLKETMVIVVDQYASYLSQLCEIWSCLPYCELSVLVSSLKALASIHQSHHWQASGDTSYGDHLLYERLYNGVLGQIDSIAEKAVAFGGEDLVCPQKLEVQTMDFVSAVCACNSNLVSAGGRLAAQSLEAEKHFTNLLGMVIDSLKAKGQLTHGISNLLEGVADAHETNCYLLGQRIKG